MLIVCSDQTIS